MTIVIILDELYSKHGILTTHLFSSFYIFHEIKGICETKTSSELLIYHIENTKSVIINMLLM